MDYVPGLTMKAHLRLGRFQRERWLEILETVARAAGYGHSQGVWHRDLKPGNVLIDACGRVVLTDFGIARADFLEASLTRSGVVLGTPYYMAPEQASGQGTELGPWTDVYALGVMLYEILTGAVPHQGASLLELPRKIEAVEPVRPRRVQPSIERELEAICLKALDKDPRRRFPEATAFADDLGRFRRGEAVRARPHLFFRQFRRVLIRRIPSLVGGGILLVLALGALSLYGARSQRAYQTHFRRL